MQEKAVKGEKNKKKKRKKRRGARGRAKNRTISVTHLSPPTLRSFKRDLEIEKGKKKNDSQILLFQPLSHGRKLLIL